jgi:hypothetical protein
MAADIVILDIREQAGGIANIRFCCWFNTANPYPASNFMSAYPDIATDPTVGPSGQDVLNKLQAGTMTEEVFSVLVPISMIASSWVTVQAYLLAILNARKAYKAGTSPAVPAIGLKYKILHDTVTNWSA